MTTITSESDCSIIQEDLNNVMDWGCISLTNFNLHKCKVLSFGVQVSIKNIYSMSYTGEDMELRRMGVLFNSSLKFGYHVNKVVHKANRLLVLIKRTLVTYLEPQMLLSLYATLVKS